MESERNRIQDERDIRKKILINVGEGKRAKEK